MTNTETFAEFFLLLGRVLHIICNFLFQSNWARTGTSRSPAVPKLPVASWYTWYTYYSRWSAEVLDCRAASLAVALIHLQDCHPCPLYFVSFVVGSMGTKNLKHGIGSNFTLLNLFTELCHPVVQVYIYNNVSHVNELQPLTSDIWMYPQSAPGEREYLWIQIYSWCLTKLAQFVPDVI